MWVPHFLTRADLQLFNHRIGEYNQIIYGLVLLLVMILMPEGIVGFARRAGGPTARRRVLGGRRTWLSDFLGLTRPPIARCPPRRARAAPVPPPRRRGGRGGRRGRDGAALLRADDIQVDFGGVRRSTA